MSNHNERSIVIFCRQFRMGGTETLILRLLNWYNAHGHRTVLLTIDPIINTAILKDFEKSNIEHYQYNIKFKEFLNGSVKLNFESKKQVLVINNYLPEFFQSFLLLKKSKYKCEFVHLIYIVHPYSAYLNSRKTRFLGKRMIKIFLQKKIILFMDEYCIEETEKYYGFSPGSYDCLIYRLPILIDNNNYQLIKNKGERLNILTIARFEFPFKGYILGLIKSFVKLYEFNKNITLTIIGYGEGKKEIDSLLFSISNEIKDRVFILNQIPYSEIKDRIADSDVYVGMGTTVLDAANQCKIVICAVAYQTEKFTTGFFHDNYRIIAEIYKKGVKYKKFEELLLEVSDMSNDEFQNYSILSKSLLINNYDISNIANKIKEQPLNNFKLKDTIIINIVCLLNILASKIYKLFRLNGYSSNL